MNQPGGRPDVTVDSFAADRWFLSRGLPAVVRRSALLRHVLSRAAPALAAVAVIAANSLLIVGISGQHTVDIAGRPDLRESLVLALVVVVLPVAVTVGWLVSNLDSAVRRSTVAALSLAVIAIGALLGGPAQRTSVNITLFATAVAVIVVLTVTGVGAILGWAAELTLTNLALAAGMFVRSLPVVLLTFLVFFNTYVWLMTSLISRGRLWLGIGFLILVAGSFLVSTTLEQVRPMLTAPPTADGDDDDLVATPFSAIPDPGQAYPLSLAERVNAVFVVAASQLVHVLTVAVLTGAVFFVLGMILVSPPVLDAWTRGNGRPDGELLGMTLPIPEALLQTTMLLTAITFMYLSAKAVTDAQYRVQFLDPMLDNLRVTLRARGRYWSVQDGGSGRRFRTTVQDGVTMPDDPAADVFGKRYGEVLLLRMGDAGPEATVYNTFPLNDCPAQLWDALDADALAKENGALGALLNGPRYWLMSRIGKRAGEPQPIRSFGGIEMIEQATVALPSNNPAPYSVNKVDRRAVFTFGTGRPIFELVDADGRRWVMQTFSQVVDKGLSLQDLPGLGPRLKLPEGWHYETRTLTSPLVVDTTDHEASVLQDDLTNTYSLLE